MAAYSQTAYSKDGAYSSGAYEFDASASQPAFSHEAFGKDTAFSSLAFAFDTGPTPPPTTFGGHFGKKHRERDFTEEVEAKKRLREQVRLAVEGPQAEVAQEALKDYIHPQKSDSRYVPVEHRIDWAKIYKDMEMVELTLLLHLAAAEDEEDDDFMLLN